MLAINDLHSSMCALRMKGLNDDFRLGGLASHHLDQHAPSKGINLVAPTPVNRDACSNVSNVRTAVFDTWLSKLKDSRGKARIVERIRSAERGNFGDCESVGNGVSEMRVHFGPGYRV